MNIPDFTDWLTLATLRDTTFILQIVCIVIYVPLIIHTGREKRRMNREHCVLKGEATQYFLVGIVFTIDASGTRNYHAAPHDLGDGRSAYFYVMVSNWVTVGRMLRDSDEGEGSPIWVALASMRQVMEADANNALVTRIDP